MPVLIIYFELIKKKILILISNYKFLQKIFQHKFYKMNKLNGHVKVFIGSKN